MTLADALDSVRRALAPGWSQHGCRDVDGLYCPHDAEMVAVYDLHGAVYAHAGPLVLEVWDALDAATDETALAWSLDEGRTHTDVMAAVGKALERQEQIERIARGQS